MVRPDWPTFSADLDLVEANRRACRAVESPLADLARSLADGFDDLGVVLPFSYDDHVETWGVSSYTPQGLAPGDD